MFQRLLELDPAWMLIWKTNYRFSDHIGSSIDVYLENKLLVLRPYQFNFDSESKNKAQKSHIKDPWPLPSPNDFLHSGVWKWHKMSTYWRRKTKYIPLSVKSCSQNASLASLHKYIAQIKIGVSKFSLFIRG